MKKYRVMLIFALIILLMPIFAWSKTSYESFYRLIGSHPFDQNSGYSEDVQGVTHDNNYWYITQTAELWRIPVTHDLNSVSPSDSGVVKKYLSDYSVLDNLGYHHFGDLSCYRYGTKDYLIIPIEGGPHPAIAIFLADSTLAYYAYAELGNQQTSAAWCAVDPMGNIYTSNWGDVYTIQKYSVNWARLANQSILELQFVENINLFDENGLPHPVHDIQGGVFSPSGSLLYVACGYMVGWPCEGEDLSEEWMRANGGIHVFDTHSWRKVRKSTNDGAFFGYEFHPGGLTCEEPEGLTIWDLDDGRAPNISGQLHAFILDNDASADEVEMRHYTGTVYVSEGFVGGDGEINSPYGTLNEAFNLIFDKNWKGAVVKIDAGDYPELVDFSWPIQMKPWTGEAVIGNHGRISLGPGGAINVEEGGGMKVY